MSKEKIDKDKYNWKKGDIKIISIPGAKPESEMVEVKDESKRNKHYKVWRKILGNRI